jgi:hypothetical protein
MDRTVSPWLNYYREMTQGHKIPDDPIYQDGLYQAKPDLRNIVEDKVLRMSCLIVS